jgi:rod shape-determining protein MreD
MMLALRAAPLVIVSALVQVTVIGGGRILGAELDLLLVTVVAIALLRGSVPGAVAGFLGGVLVDVMTLSTLGVTSLLLTLAGYWAGRYGETTGRGRAYAAPVAAFAATLFVGLSGAALHFLLGDAVPVAAVLSPLLPTAILAAIVVFPVRRVCRALLGETLWLERAREVEIV